MANAGTYGSQGAASSTPTSGAGGGGNFPQQGSQQQNLALIESLGVTSSQAPSYLASNGQLNTDGQALVAYYNMTQPERQAIQSAMAQAGLIGPTAVTGIADSSSDATAFRKALAEASRLGYQGTSSDPLSGFVAYLNNVGQGGLGTIENQLSGNLTAAQKLVDSTSAVAASETNPTTLQAAIESAFNQTLGYAPSQAQISSFVNAIQNQDVQYAQSSNEATRAAAKADIAQAQSEQSALNKLGPDGVDAFLQAYQQAIAGTGVRGAGTSQGPVEGQQTLPGAASGIAGANYFGTAPPASDQIPTEQVNTPGTPGQTRQVPNGNYGVLGALEHNVAALGRGQFNNGVTPGTTRPGTHGETIPGTPGHTTIQEPVSANAAQFAQPTSYGGVFALTPAVWKKAQDAFPGAKKYGSAGAAPVAVQQAAVTALAQNLYQQYGQWSQVAVTLAGGTPTENGKTPVLKGAHLTMNELAQQTAADVNNQITNLQNTVNTQPTVTMKTTQPDYQAEANQAAKAADPAGYYAANYASWGSLLGRMLYGRPLDIMQSTADTFTGPVGATTTPSVAATGAAATAPTAATAA